MSRTNVDEASQTNSSFPADLLVALDRSRPRQLRAQLEGELRRLIQIGQIPAGTRLPPSRALADDLDVSRSVVVEAYGQLVADGYLEARRGSATRVRSVAAAHPRVPLVDDQPQATVRFLGGLPDPAVFPRLEWQRHYRAALTALPDAELGYPGPLGAPALREALAGYLGRVRGVVTSSTQLLVTAGFTQALALLCGVLRARGVRAVALEDPCFGIHRELITRAGLRPVPIPVDEDGLDVARLGEHEVGAVLVAPAHSYPSGAVLSGPRRAALLDWARRSRSFVIEDDYDAEFRYDRTPIGALQGLAPDQVVHAGCVSKTLTPALRLGWLALPAELINEVAAEKLFADMGSTLIEQLALARFISTGGFARHLRRVRPIYRARRDTAVEALVSALPGARPTGVAAGLHLCVRLPVGCRERELCDAARARGVLVEGAAWHWADPASAPPALVLGYGALSRSAIREGIGALEAVYRGGSPHLVGGSHKTGAVRDGVVRGSGEYRAGQPDPHR